MTVAGLEWRPAPGQNEPDEAKRDPNGNRAACLHRRGPGLAEILDGDDRFRNDVVHRVEKLKRDSHGVSKIFSHCVNGCKITVIHLM
jgi:hypothetical protein